MVIIIIIDLKLTDVFSINKQRTITSIVKIKQNLTFALVNLILNLNSGVPVLQLIPSVGPRLNTKKLWTEIIYLAKSSPKLHEVSLLNSII